MAVCVSVEFNLLTAVAGQVLLKGYSLQTLAWYDRQIDKLFVYTNKVDFESGLLMTHS